MHSNTDSCTNVFIIYYVCAVDTYVIIYIFTAVWCRRTHCTAL